MSRIRATNAATSLSDSRRTYSSRTAGAAAARWRPGASSSRSTSRTSALSSSLSIAPPSCAASCMELLERRFRRHSGIADLGLVAGKVEAPVGTDHAIVHHLDVGVLLGLVAGQDGVRRRLALEQVQRLAAEDHRAELVAVDQEGMLVVDAGHHLRSEDLR